MSIIDTYYIANVQDLDAELVRTIDAPHSRTYGMGYYDGIDEPTTIITIVGGDTYALRRLTTFAWAQGEDSILWIRTDADGPHAAIVSYDLGTDTLRIERI